MAFFDLNASSFEIFIGWGGGSGRPIARDLTDFLNQRMQFHCFYAGEITPGMSELDEIVREIENCDAAVMIVTKKTRESFRWSDELKYLYDCGVPILPFVSKGSAIPPILRYMGLQRLYFNPRNPSEKFEEISGILPILIESRSRAFRKAI